MDFLFLVIIFFVVLVPLVLGIVIPRYMEHNKVTGNIVNYDPFMQKFVYKIYMSQEEIINTLNTLRSHLSEILFTPKTI